MTRTDDEDLYPSPLRIALDELLDPSCTDPTREQGEEHRYDQHRCKEEREVRGKG